MIIRKSKVNVFKFYEDQEKIDFLLQIRPIQGIKIVAPTAVLFVEVETDNEQIIEQIKQISTNYSLRN